MYGINNNCAVESVVLRRMSAIIFSNNSKQSLGVGNDDDDDDKGFENALWLSLHEYSKERKGKGKKWISYWADIIAHML